MKAPRELTNSPQATITMATATWRQITDAVSQLANLTPPGGVLH